MFDFDFDSYDSEKDPLVPPYGVPTPQMGLGEEGEEGEFRTVSYC